MKGPEAADSCFMYKKNGRVWAQTMVDIEENNLPIEFLIMVESTEVEKYKAPDLKLSK
jgi:hypothetical protein